MYSILSRYKYQCCNISRDSSQANKAKQRPSTSVTHFLPINLQTHFQHSKGQIITSFSFAFPITIFPQDLNFFLKFFFTLRVLKVLSGNSRLSNFNN